MDRQEQVIHQASEVHYFVYLQETCHRCPTVPYTQNLVEMKIRY
jgi:alkyl hydroperoxide reductase subunit AhpF